MKRAVLDIETIPNGDFGEELPPEQAKKLALDALTGRVVCVGILLLEDFRIQERTAFVSADEHWILRETWSWLEIKRVNRFITHNGLNFDLPYLWRRSVVNQIKPSVQIDLRKYRTDMVFDTMSVWGNWEHRASASLDSLSRAFGLGGKTGAGSQVADLWKLGAFGQIADYCLHDCWLTYGCFCRMNFVEPQPAESVPSSLAMSEGMAMGDGLPQLLQL